LVRYGVETAVLKYVWASSRVCVLELNSGGSLRCWFPSLVHINVRVLRETGGNVIAVR